METANNHSKRGEELRGCKLWEGTYLCNGDWIDEERDGGTKYRG